VCKEKTLGKISNRLKNLFLEEMDQKVVNIADIRSAKVQAGENLGSIHSLEDLIEEVKDPSTAVYINMQNLVAVLMEGLLSLKPLASFHKFMVKQEDLYQPSYPPMSPITDSYFSLFTEFDAAFGDDKETIGSCIYDLSDLFQISGIQKTALRNLCDSHMGIYEIEKIASDKFGSLREYQSNKTVEVRFDLGFEGEVGDVVFVRILPNLVGDGHHVAMTTPYQIVGYSEREWDQYFERQGIEKNAPGFELKYYEHMKYGKDKNYWSEYVFWAYMQYRPDVVFLTGLPDKKSTQPCHDLFSEQMRLMSSLQLIQHRFLNHKILSKKSVPGLSSFR
jgi:hypothetical protein